ncbi:nucleotide exchange factor GrpE [Thiomicrolovo sp. ZZH C-3]
MSQEENKPNNEETLPNDEEMIEEMVSEEAEEVGSDLERVQMELDQLKDKYTRVHADFDNIKKRLEREKYQALEYAQEKFAKDLIPVVDSLEMAVKAADGEGMEASELLAKVKEGVELTMKQFLSALEKHGITAVGEEEPFDPNVHHAVQQVDSPDHESGEIVSTFQKGYKYKERTLRDAMVVIAN